MKQRSLTRISALPAVAALMLFAQMPPVAAQTATKTTPKAASPAAPAFTVPRTAWGDPDLEGVYTFATLTPFQRPAAQAGKDVLTEAEQKALEVQLKKQQEENI